MSNTSVLHGVETFFFFFHLYLHYYFTSCFSSGRAGRRMWKGGEKECLLACRSAHVCSSLVGYNIIKFIFRSSLGQLNLFSVFSSPCTSHHHLLSYLLLCRVLFCCLSLFFIFPNSPSLLQQPLLFNKPSVCQFLLHFEC